MDRGRVRQRRNSQALPAARAERSGIRSSHCGDFGASEGTHWRPRQAIGAARGYLYGTVSAREPPNLKLSRAVTDWMSTPASVTRLTAAPPPAGVWLRIPTLNCT